MDVLEALSQVEWPSILLAVTAGLPLLYMLWRITLHRPEAASSHEEAESIPMSTLAAALATSLPGCVFFPQNAEFASSLGSYWSKQNRELKPECVIKPNNEQEVSTAVKIVKQNFDECLRQHRTPPTFAIRSGGHSTVPGASNVQGGVVFDLSHLDQVELAVDHASAVVGSGARWGDVSRKLDGLGLAVVGGRNSDVGVGGLTLGGGYSYFSPHHGFVCDNVLEYRIVLASGDVKTVSEHKDQQLWRALKGGGNNFGVVTSFRLRTVACTNVWSGFLYMLSWSAPQVIETFHKFTGGTFDESAGGPLLCISYVQQIGLTVIATHLMYTKATVWPTCWRDFKNISRIWSSTKVRTLTSTTDELDSISPAGFRQLHISTTVKNDLATLNFAHDTFRHKARLLKKVKGMVWTLVLQPLHMSTMMNGKHNVFGLGDRKTDLVVVLFTAVWERQSDDDLVNGSGRAAVNEIDTYALNHKTGDKFRYLNWCDGTQRPFQSYGAENLRFLKDTSKQFDPDGFFQQGCAGGHKIMEE